MELITNKGKILGIINIIDLIILIILILMGVIFYKYVIMLDWEKYDFGELSYEVVERKFSFRVQINDFIILNSIIPNLSDSYRGQIVGFIDDVQIINYNLGDKNITIIDVKIVSNLTKINNDLYYNINNPPGQIVKVGNNFKFNSEKINFEGKIISVE